MELNLNAPRFGSAPDGNRVKFELVEGGREVRVSNVACEGGKKATQAETAPHRRKPCDRVRTLRPCDPATLPA
jgi:hypothetical protein